VIAAVNRCATQNQPQKSSFSATRTASFTVIFGARWLASRPIGDRGHMDVAACTNVFVFGEIVCKNHHTQPRLSSQV
jgi:hypothetical protein